MRHTPHPTVAWTSGKWSSAVMSLLPVLGDMVAEIEMVVEMTEVWVYSASPVSV